MFYCATFTSRGLREGSWSKGCLVRSSPRSKAEIFTVQTGYSGFISSLLDRHLRHFLLVSTRSAAVGSQSTQHRSGDAREQPTCSQVYVSGVGREITRPKRYLVLSLLRGCVVTVAQSDVGCHSRLDPMRAAGSCDAILSWLSPSSVSFVLSSHPLISCYVSRLHLSGFPPMDW